MRKIIHYLIIAVILIFPGCGSEKGNTKYQSFIDVKKILLNQIYKDHRISFYCGCSFSKAKKVRCKTGKGSRAGVIEWEHIVPASRFGKTFKAWKKESSFGCKFPSFIRKILFVKCRTLSARENARRLSKEYRLMESDMYNLVPAIGFINQKRSNYAYGIIPGEKKEFGRCDFEISGKLVEPAPGIRGDIARTYFYMEDAYPGHNIMNKSEKKLFSEWAEKDPVDKWECERCKRIEAFQGNSNPFVKNPCREKGFWQGS